MTARRSRRRGIRYTLSVSEHDHDLDRLLRALPAAPSGWVARAEEFPMLLEAAESVSQVESVSQGDDRAALRTALVEVGLEPDEDHVRALERIVRRESAP